LSSSTTRRRTRADPLSVYRFDLAGGGVDGDVHETAVPAKGHDDIQEVILDPAEIGPDDFRSPQGLAGRRDGLRRGHDLLVGDCFAHFARIEAVEDSRRDFSLRDAYPPHQSGADPEPPHPKILLRKH